MRAYAELVRLPNAFTAMADIAMAVLAVVALDGEALPPRWGVGFAGLVLGSLCMYLGGMVWNDYFDLDEDRRLRPERPLPSGRVLPGDAFRLGLGLLTAGPIFALFAGWRAFQIAVLLVGAILLYDGWLKRTWLGPVSMGLCRFLNVLLGLSLSTSGIHAWGYHAALVVGLYVAGVTWFARREATRSKERALAAAGSVVLAGLILALLLPVRVPAHSSSPAFPYVLVGLGFLVGIPMIQALRRPMPRYVQAAVKRALLGIVVLDAALASALAGTVGLSLLLLLPPAVWLGRRLYST